VTDRQGTVEGKTQEGQDHPQWRVEGSESSDNGLGDTVVRIPKITDDSPAPKLPSAPKPRTGRTGRQPAVTETGEVRKPTVKTAPAEKPAEVQPAPEAKSEATTVIKPSSPSPFAPADAPAPVRPAAAAPLAAAPLASAPTAPVAPAPTLPPAPFTVPKAYGPTATTTTAAVPAAVGAATSPVSAAKPSGLRRTRKARLRLSKVDPWSVMKTSFLFSIAFGIMFVVSIAVVWTVVEQSGLFDAINAAIVNIISSPNSTSTWRIEDYINGNKVLGIAALLAVINVVISTALGTLAAFLYNLSANILGGLELTLAED